MIEEVSKFQFRLRDDKRQKCQNDNNNYNPKIGGLVSQKPVLTAIIYKLCLRNLALC